MHFRFTSQPLSSRFFAGASMVCALTIFSVSAFSQSSFPTLSIPQQQSIEKNQEVEPLSSSRTSLDRPDAVSLADDSKKLSQFPDPSRAPRSEQEFKPANEKRLGRFDPPNRLPDTDIPSESVKRFLDDYAALKPRPVERLGDDWRPEVLFPKRNRFNVDRTNDPDDPAAIPSEKFHWKDAILQSLVIQGLQHGYALTAQPKTRRALKGPFFQDYIDSLKGLKGWDDGNKFFTNYIAHPMQGAMTGFIFLQNHDRMKKQKFGESRQYWKDRAKAFVWSAAWSTNWELGPISQSTIGNVGLYDKQGYVDLVMTPTAGTGWMVFEEAMDRFVIRHIESKNFLVKMLARTLLNPMRSVANALRLKKPWYRDRPFGH